MKISASKGFLPANHPVKASPRLRNGSPLDGPAEHEVLLDVLEMAGCCINFPLPDCESFPNPRQYDFLHPPVQLESAAMAASPCSGEELKSHGFTVAPLCNSFHFRQHQNRTTNSAKYYLQYLDEVIQPLTSHREASSSSHQWERAVLPHEKEKGSTTACERT